MNSSLAINVPQSGPAFSSHRIAWVDVIAGLLAHDIWGRLGWRDTKRRYRRTVFGPLWTTVSLALVVGSLGFVWSNLWHKDPRTYLPYLTSGMLCWIFFLAICTEGCNAFCAYEKLIKQLRISYTLLACAIVWRNGIVFFHNLIIFVLVALYGGIAINWSTFLVIPGFALFYLNTIWIVILLGTACARYRDLLQLVTNLLQITLFLTPIFWSPDQMTGRAVLFAQLNPLFHLVEIVREPMLGIAPSPLHWVVVLGITAVGWTLAIQVLAKFRHRIVYWI
jgi:ABC-type polysaccharide/polyol phosphate export permease